MDAEDLIQSIDQIATYSPPLHDGTVNRRLVDAALGAGVEVIQGRLAPGGTANRHMHRDSWQFILVQGGRVRVELGDDVVREVGPGTVVRIPPMLPHYVEVLGDAPAELIVIYSPPFGPDGFIPA